MKPIIQDESIIAKLGNRELTREELRRLPEGIKDRVKFFPKDYNIKTEEDTLDDYLFVSINSGLVVANLDEKILTADEFRELPEDLARKVIFNITQKGKDYLQIPLKERLRTWKGGIGWESRGHFITDFNISNLQLDNLLRAGLVKIIRNHYVIDNYDGKALERINSFLAKPTNEHKEIRTEWSTKEELANTLDISVEETDRVLKHHIEAGFMEEREGLYRINDSDGRGMQRIKEYLGRIDRFHEGKLTQIDAIESMVKGGIFDAIKKDWIEFQDGKNYTAEEWEGLDKVEQNKVGIRLTEKGRREIEDDNTLKIYDELAGKKNAEGGFNIIEDVETDDEGYITLKLTPEGERIKKLGESMGISSEKVFQTMLNVGLRKQMARYMIIEDKLVEGNRRVK